MSFNPQGAIPVSLEVFSGLVTEMPAETVPAGCSPDNQEAIYRPGGVAQRPGLTKVFSDAFGAVTVTYEKSYIDGQGNIRNLYLDSTGNLWVENLAAPGTYTLLGTVTPGSYAKSVTAFGTEYIAFSDGLHGTDVPLQYDGQYLDRVSQDGPGVPPSIINLALSPSAMAVISSASPLTVNTITTVDPITDPDFGFTYYTAIDINVVSGAAFIGVGGTIVVSGSGGGAFDGTFTVISIIGDTDLICSFYSGVFLSESGGAVAYGGVSAQRANNTVTVYTGTPHGLKVGYLAQISQVSAQPIGFMTTIVIDNVASPGIATITVANNHGLVPGNQILILGVPATAVGGATDAARAGGITTFTTATAHGLSPGALVTTAGISGTGFNSNFVVETVPTDTTFTVTQITDADGTGTGGTTSLNWISSPNSNQPDYWTVLEVPTPTTLTVAVNYSSGTWTMSSSGNIQFPWVGTFFVNAVPDSTTFQYQQYGPDGTTTDLGTVTPTGQAAPGLHQMQVLFQTRAGYITAPSPPVLFTANGGQYLSISNIPIGPSNVIARILAFTGAGGAFFFYIPVPAQENGQVVSTATQINDNSTTNIVLDFSDNTLFAAIGINVPGNNLVAQIVLEGALAFASYSERLIAFGQRNRVNSFLNMGFEGGFLASSPLVPLGWNVTGAGGSLIAGGAWADGNAYQFTIGTPSISQSAYQNSYGVPILQPNTPYSFRVWLQGAGGTLTATISSVSTGFSSSATFNSAPAASFQQVAFSVATPLTIPNDMTLTITGTGVVFDEMSVIYAKNPYVETTALGSYLNNPEAFDGLSGKFGPDNDQRKMMAMGIVRSTLYMLTQEPSGRIHSVQASNVSEPAGWNVEEIGSNCGILSAFSLTVSQADDESGSGGEEWMSWASSSGARIFGGNQPWKISQEIQPDWDLINPAAAKTTWALNDPVTRRVYYGLPIDNATAPNIIYVMDYRELDTAEQIAQSPPVHTSLSGKLIATDHVRKWTRWRRGFNTAALMYRQPGQVTPCFAAGNGAFPGSVAGGFGNAYFLCPNKLTDDDYGFIGFYYVTAALPTSEAQGIEELGYGLRMVQYFSYEAVGLVGQNNGNVKITAFVNQLNNPWRFNLEVPVNSTPPYDEEWTGASVTGQRFFFKFESLPG